LNMAIKLSGLENLDPTVRTFIVLAVAVAFPAWDVGFELGAFGQLFYDKLFMAWSVSAALFFALIAIPRDRLRIPPVAWVAVAFPTAWIILALLARASPEITELRYVLVVAGLVVYLACFPYMIYMALSIAYPDLMGAGLAWPKIGLIVIILVLCTSGYIAGENNSRIMTCEDFEISGQYIPQDCHPASPRWRLRRFRS